MIMWMWWRIKRVEKKVDGCHGSTQKKIDQLYSYVTNGVDGKGGLADKFVTRREYDLHRQSEHKTK